MPSRNGLTLSDFRRMGILLTWPEAVAVVLEATDQVKRSGDTGVTPDLDHVLIVDNGAVTILPGSPIPAHPVRQAAVLLADLLDGAAAPSELRALVAENQRSPPACAWIEEFTTALAYYERPHRDQIISALVKRAKSRDEGGPEPAPKAAGPPSDAPPPQHRAAGRGGVVEPWWRRLFGKKTR